MFIFPELTGKQQQRCFNHLLRLIKGFSIFIPHFACMAAVMDVALVATQSLPARMQYSSFYHCRGSNTSARLHRPDWIYLLSGAINFSLLLRGGRGHASQMTLFFAS